MIKNIELSNESNFSLPFYRDGLESVVLTVTEDVTFPVELGAEVTVTFKVTSISRKESL